jgi:hypothetical protein
MKLRAYSSFSAFMAHYAALRSAQSDAASAASAVAANPDDAATLFEMERLIAELSAADRDVLHDEAASISNAVPSRTTGRQRARAELKLRRLLAGRGLLTG